MQDSAVQSLGQKDPLAEGMATHSSILGWKIPWTEEPGGLQSMESWRVGHNWAIKYTWVFIATCGLSCPEACGILSCLTSDQVCVPCSGRQTLNHWTTREVPQRILSSSCFMSPWLPILSLGWVPAYPSLDHMLPLCCKGGWENKYLALGEGNVLFQGSFGE